MPNNELMTHGTHCPKCGNQFKWMITEEPKYELVVLHLYCSDCKTSDALALSRREFLEKMLGGES